MAKSEGQYYYKFKPQGISRAAWKGIITAWQDGLSDREAAFRASREDGILITEAELKELVATDERIADLRDYLHSDVLMMAKQNIAESIREGSVSTAKWLLERKAANEYSTKASVNFENAVIGLSMAEKEAEMDKFMDKFIKGFMNKGDSDGEGEV